MRSILIRTIVGLAATIAVSGCATYSPDAAQYADSRTYPDSIETIWNRLLAYSTQNSMLVSRTDHDNGIIDVEREVAYPQSDSVFDWADCGWNPMIERAVSQQINLHYLVQTKLEGTAVTINGEFKEQRLNLLTRKSHWVTCSSTGALEQQLLKAIYFE